MRFLSAVAAFLLLPASLFAGPLTFRKLAGPASGGGYVDGRDARFSIPYGIVTDAAGNTYVTDSGNSAIRRIAPNGIVSTLAGNGRAGSADGAGTAARFRHPRGLDLAPDGALIVADTSNARIRRVTMDGTVTTIAGTTAGTLDGPAHIAQFLFPRAVAVAPSGTIYVADANAIRKIDSAGVTTFAGQVWDAGHVDGPGATARFHQIAALTIGPDGILYVADLWGSLIRRVTPAGDVSTVISLPVQPTALRFDAEGVLWIASNVTLHRLTPNGLLTSVPIELTQEPSNFTGLAFQPSGNLLLADTQQHTIRRRSSTGELTIRAGSLAPSGTIDGAPSDARFLSPFPLAADSLGNVFVGDGIGIRRITPSGFVTTPGYEYPCNGVAVDPGNRLLCSTGSEVWRLGSGNVHIAGATLERGYVNSHGSAARFGSASGLAADAQGNIYVADAQNHVVRRIDGNGMVTTLAGNGIAGNGDGTRGTAQFVLPFDVAVDADGSVYVLDNAGARIRRIAPDGTVTTLPCRGIAAPSCVPNAIRFARDVDGVFYASSRSDHVIYRITPDGDVETVGGLLGAPGNVDGRGDEARFDAPGGIAVTPDGRLVVAASGSHAIHVAVLPPVIDGFRAERTAEGTRLTWSAHYATGASIDGVGTVPVSGNVVVTGSGPFRLTVTSEGGSASTTTRIGRRRPLVDH